MPSNTEHDRNRTYFASVLRLLFVPVALFVSFHAEPASAVSPVVESIAAYSENTPGDASAPTEAELPMCDLTDGSLAVAPGACSGATDLAALEVVPPAPQEDAVKALADKAAPMCALDATSIAAPVDVPEVDRGHFEPLPCDVQPLLSRLRSQAREGGIQLIVARESPPRAPLQAPSPSDGNDGSGTLSVTLDWPERAAPSTLAPHCGGELAWQPGHRSRIERPPSRRA